MKVFGDYSKYYDLLYADKDYAGEAGYVAKLIKAANAGARSILDLGCGTGRHARELATLGFEVCGVDLSPEMIEVARKTPVDGVSYVQGDVGSVRLGRQFDVVSALFHVFSYQISNAALSAAFATAEVHLHAGGLLIFDAWYGPAVLSSQPEVRIKRLGNDAVEIVRIAEPALHADRNTVDVNYEVHVRNLVNGNTSRIKESHSMRYLFGPEVESYAEAAGMRIVTNEEWITGKRPGVDTWGVVFVCEKC